MQIHNGNVDTKVVNWIVKNAGTEKIVSLDIETKVLDGNFLSGETILGISVSRSIGVPDLGLNDMKKFAIPLAPTKEQKIIVTKINEFFSFETQIEKSIKKAKKRADRIDQAILAKAFRGELVPQDPNDEPAEKLERIYPTKT